MDINEEFNFLSAVDPLDDLWPLYEGILEQQNIYDHLPNEGIVGQPLLMSTIEDYCYSKEIDTISTEILTVEQQHSELPQVAPLKKGLKKTNMISSIAANSRKRKEIIRRNSSIIVGNKGKGVMLDGEEGQTSSSSLVAKKMDHNAKERIRRMNLNASYLALRSLLPNSRRSKKRWTAPSTVDKVIKYIPELENEIEELAYKEEQLQSATANKKIPSISYNNIENSSNSHSPPTVSVHKVDEEEAIIQICMEAKEDGSTFTNLLQKVEDEGIGINSASTRNVCKSRTSYHLHIQMNRVSSAENIAELRDKVISWLR